MNYNRLIDYFKVAPTDGTKMDVVECISICAKYGYIPQPECCTKEVADYAKSKDWNPNSTFYKTWKEVQEKTRFEIFIDQLRHYASTYGTGYREEAWVPNNDPIKINYNTYTVIEAISPKDLADKCMAMLQSGIALSDAMLNDCVQYVAEAHKKYGYKIDIDSIKNRDALIKMCDLTGLVPVKGQSIVQYIYNKVLGSPMIVQSRNNIKMIRYWLVNGRSVDLSKLTDEQVVELSKVFYRFKNVLLAFREVAKNRPIINKIRRMAVKNHEPMRVGYWENLTNLSAEVALKQLDSQVAKLDNPFKIIRLIQMIETRKLQNQRKMDRVFFIRNGKSFTKNAYPSFPSFLFTVREKLRNKLMEMVAKNVQGFVVKFPENINLACPVSEKKFFGNVPFYSSVPLRDKDNFFGVYWRNEWGTRDFDLSFISTDGNKVGWNASYGNSGMTFSGDMTNAEPEATEMFYIKQQCPSGVIFLNRFNGDEGSKYQLFVGQQHIKNLTRSYMVDPNNIFMRVDGVSTAKQQQVGYIKNNVLYLFASDRGSSIVSSEKMNELELAIETTLSLEEILLGAGAIKWYEGMANAKGEKIEPNIDLSNCTKDLIIDLFRVD